VLSLMTFGMSPAQAAPTTTSPQASATTHLRAARQLPRGLAVGERRCGPDVNARVANRCASTGPQQFSESGCGFLQRCLYFSRSEQLTILAGSGAGLVVLICGATALLGCAAASAVVGAAFQWLSNRGGICPTSKPKLGVRYFPMPSVQGCVA
jgi:hypothetical protein